MIDVAVLILAAGKGTRMYSETAKVLQPLCGRPMLYYPLAAAKALRPARIMVVVGHGAEEVRRVFASTPVDWVVQPQQLGTAHAVRCALPRLRGFAGPVLICCGDMPLVTGATLCSFLQRHMAAGVDLSILTMVLEEPGDYGRIIRDSQGRPKAIIEARDVSDKESRIREVNAGLYCASAALLRAAIPLIDNVNAQGEYYLTDLLQKAVEQGWKVQAIAASDPQELQGVNTREELLLAAHLIASRTRC